MATPGTDRSLSWICDEARRLRETGALHGRAWSLAQVCEHLALAVQGTVDPLVFAASPSDNLKAPEQPTWWTSLSRWQRLKRRTMKHGLLWSGRFPDAVPSPGSVLPTAAPVLDLAIDRLGSAAKAFDRKLRSPDAQWVPHPLLGPMSGRQWKRFHDLHARHHFKFMKSAD